MQPDAEVPADGVARSQSDEVSLDLNGFGVIGPRGAQGSGIGIEAVPGADRVRCRTASWSAPGATACSSGSTPALST